jgi:hypothetical protein
MQYKIHGMKNTSTYISWKCMKTRCLNKNAKNYYRYGGRGIKIYPEWKHSFLAFLRDMGERPEGMTFDRKNNDRGYFPDNCKWSTYAEQNLNKKSFTIEQVLQIIKNRKE